MSVFLKFCGPFGEIQQAMFSMPWVVKISGEISDVVQVLWPFFSIVETYMQKIHSLYAMGDKMGTLSESYINDNEV